MATFRQPINTGLVFTQADGFAALSSAVAINSNAEITVFSETLSNGAVGGINVLRFCFICNVVSGLIAPTLTLKLRLGTAILTMASAVPITASMATAKPILVTGFVMGQNSNNVQYALSEIHATGALNLSGVTTCVDAGFTLDATQPLALALSAQFGSVTTGTTLTPQRVRVEIS